MALSYVRAILATLYASIPNLSSGVMPLIPEDRFEEILKLVRSHLIAANVHLTIWEELRSTTDRHRLFNTYPGFFSWTSDAHVDRFIHKICVVTDSDGSQPSIWKLVNMIQSHPSLAPKINSNAVSGRLENHEQARMEIRTLRDTRSSHWDLKKKPPEPDVTQCKELLVELNSILEDIWNSHWPNPNGGREILSLIPTGSRHPSYVLNKLTAMLPGNNLPAPEVPGK